VFVGERESGAEEGEDGERVAALSGELGEWKGEGGGGLFTVVAYYI